MNAIEAMAVGALGVVIVAALGLATYYVVSFAVRVHKTLHDGVTAAMAIQQELAYMRSLTQAAGNDSVDGVNLPQQQSGPVAQQGAMRGVVPFPSPVFDRFPHEEPRDATMEDTDVNLLLQTEEELTEMEVLEQMRERGQQVEDSDTAHPGVVAESK